MILAERVSEYLQLFKFVSVGNEAYPWRKPKSSKKLIISEQKLSALSILNIVYSNLIVINY